MTEPVENMVWSNTCQHCKSWVEEKKKNLKVNAWSVKSYVDGVGGGVVVGSQERLLIWSVADYEVHNGVWRLGGKTVSIQLNRINYKILNHKWR